MALPAKYKRLVLGGALMLTLGASAWLALGTGQTQEEADIVEAAKPVSVRRNAQQPHTGQQRVLPILAEVRASQGVAKQAEDIFKPHSWFVPPPPQVARMAQAVAAPPLPPPVPFTYLGTMQEGGQTVVFLSKEQKLYTVRKGEVFDGQYRMENEGSGRIELVYLPLNAKQILVIKGAS